MKVPMAFCLNCGWVTQDLDELDAHTANCTGSSALTPELVRRFHCRCGATPGLRCISNTGQFLGRGSEHTYRWDRARRQKAPS
jgi:hypothetical protein